MNRFAALRAGLWSVQSLLGRAHIADFGSASGRIHTRFDAALLTWLRCAGAAIIRHGRGSGGSRPCGERPPPLASEFNRGVGSELIGLVPVVASAPIESRRPPWVSGCLIRRIGRKLDKQIGLRLGDLGGHNKLVNQPWRYHVPHEKRAFFLQRVVFHLRPAFAVAPQRCRRRGSYCRGAPCPERSTAKLQPITPVATHIYIGGDSLPG